jgi:hypothetical protein
MRTVTSMPGTLALKAVGGKKVEVQVAIADNIAMEIMASSKPANRNRKWFTMSNFDLL